MPIRMTNRAPVMDKNVFQFWDVEGDELNYSPLTVGTGAFVPALAWKGMTPIP